MKTLLHFNLLCVMRVLINLSGSIVKTCGKLLYKYPTQTLTLHVFYNRTLDSSRVLSQVCEIFLAFLPRHSKVSGLDVCLIIADKAGRCFYKLLGRGSKKM